MWARILLAVPRSRLVLKNKAFACEVMEGVCGPCGCERDSGRGRAWVRARRSRVLPLGAAPSQPLPAPWPRTHPQTNKQTHTHTQVVRARFWRLLEEAGVERARVDLLPLAAANRDHLAQVGPWAT